MKLKNYDSFLKLLIDEKLNIENLLFDEKFDIDNLKINHKNKKFSCYSCNIFFVRKENLKRHEISIHLKIKPYKCLYCKESYSRLDNYKQHTNSKKHKKQINNTFSINL